MSLDKKNNSSKLNRRFWIECLLLYNFWVYSLLFLGKPKDPCRKKRRFFRRHFTAKQCAKYVCILCSAKRQMFYNQNIPNISSMLQSLRRFPFLQKIGFHLKSICYNSVFSWFIFTLIKPKHISRPIAKRKPLKITSDKWFIFSNAKYQNSHNTTSLKNASYDFCSQLSIDKAN